MGQFAVDLAKFADKVKGLSHELVGDVVIQAAQAIDLRSPVGDASYWKSPPPKGYIGGHFRGNNQIGVHVRPAGEIPGADPTGGEAMGRILAAIPDEAAGKIYYIVNNTVYGPEIERGHSRQAPQGVYELTAIDFPLFVERAAARLAA